MSYEFRTTRMVDWVDTDAAGIVHFSNFYRFMESAEHEFLRSVGLSVHMQVQGTVYTFPRVQSQCSYRVPLKFEDTVECHLLVHEVREKVILYDHLLSVVGDGGPVAAARGAIRTICIVRDETGAMKSTPIPSYIQDRIAPAPTAVWAQREKLFPIKD